MLRNVRALGASLALAVALLAIPATSPPPAAGLGPLPDCRFDDVLTVPRGYDDWSVTLVDTMLRVEKSYRPPDLVAVGNSGVTGGGLIRKVAVDDLRAMANAAADNGTPLGNVSAYRSYNTQVRLFNSYVDGYGYDRAVKFSARPGHSEHQLGLVLDFSAAGDTRFVSGTDPTGLWLAKNAWKYGWVLSYPKGKYRITCYTYEPWHYRYVGRDVAAAIHDSGLTIREYLWTHYTLVDPVTGEPLASASPGVTPPASASPEVSAPAPSATGSGSASPTAPAVPSAPPTESPAAPSGTWFGLDPPVVVAGALLLLLSIALIGAARMARGPRRRQRRGR